MNFGKRKLIKINRSFVLVLPKLWVQNYASDKKVMEIEGGPDSLIIKPVKED